MVILTVSELLADWGAGVHIIAAVVIAFASICTLIVLRKQNRTTGWLKARGRRLWRISYYLTPRLREDGTWGLPGPIPGADEGGPEIYVSLTNTGYLDERVLEIQYHIKGEGWHPVFPDAHNPRSDNSDNPALASGSNRSIYAVPPFDVASQHTTDWYFKIRPINLSDPLLVTCVRLETAKETVHVRLRSIGGIPSHPWERFGVLCKFGIHI